MKATQIAVAVIAALSASSVFAYGEAKVTIDEKTPVIDKIEIGGGGRMGCGII